MAPFWDDADTRFGPGQVSYEVYEEGYVLDYVSAFLRRTYPSDFQGTWMMVAFWNRIRPYFGFFNTEVSIMCTVPSHYIPTFIKHLLYCM